MSRNILVTMSGGTTTVINATLAGIIDKARNTTGINKILAGVPGINGVLQRDFIDLSSLGSRDTRRLSETPGSSIIGTTRISKLSVKDIEGVSKVIDNHDIK